jgi:predicted transcriptional regulator
MASREEYNSAPVISGHKNMWFLNGDLVKRHHLNRANGIMSVYNINKGQIESCLLSDFKRNRERAYSIKQTAELVNRHVKYLPQLMKSGSIPEPTGAQHGGTRGWQVRAYYSESQVREIRDILSKNNIGRPRKDGLLNNNSTPTIQELTRRMGDGILTYTRTEDGRFVPIWSETV